MYKFTLTAEKATALRYIIEELVTTPEWIKAGGLDTVKFHRNVRDLVNDVKDSCKPHEDEIKSLTEEQNELAKPYDAEISVLRSQNLSEDDFKKAVKPIDEKINADPKAKELVTKFSEANSKPVEITIKTQELYELLVQSLPVIMSKVVSHKSALAIADVIEGASKS